jgi:hypothetical protein
MPILFQEGRTLLAISAKHIVTVRNSDPSRFKQFFSRSSPDDTQHVISVLEYMRVDFTSDPTLMAGFPVITRDKTLAFIGTCQQGI